MPEAHGPGGELVPEGAVPEPLTRGRARATLRELALFLPRFVVLLKRLMQDPRVPTRSKWVAGGVVLYLVSPIDIVPDFIPGLGQMDDVVVAVLALNGLLNRVDESVVLEHWDGDADLMRMIRAGVAAASRLLPGASKRRT